MRRCPLNPAWTFDAGNPALDFVNARPPWLPPGDPRALLSWWAAAGLPGSPLLPSPEELTGLRRLAGEAQRLHDELTAGLDAWSAGRPLPPSVSHALNRILEAASETRRMARGPDGGWTLQRIAMIRGTPGYLAPLARAAAELFTSVDPARVRRCAAPPCRRWFLDASRNGSRVWCSMERCGNRAKVSAHRRRRRRAGGTE